MEYKPANKNVEDSLERDLLSYKKNLDLQYTEKFYRSFIFDYPGFRRILRSNRVILIFIRLSREEDDRFEK